MLKEMECNHMTIVNVVYPMEISCDRQNIEFRNHEIKKGSNKPVKFTGSVPIFRESSEAGAKNKMICDQMQ